MQLPLFEVLVQARLTMVNCGKSQRAFSCERCRGTSRVSGLEITQGFASVQTN